MAKKKTKAGADMIASVMEAATDNAAPAEDNKTDDIVEQPDEPIAEPDILVQNKMEIKTPIQYDDICVNKEEIIRLTKENEELKEKLMAYIDAEAKHTWDYKQLQKEYDESLMKISELSFEVAQLKASLTELEGGNANSSQAQTTSSQKTAPVKSTPVSYPYKNNGYSSWN